MLNMPDTKVRFFSVTNSTLIQGVRFIPSVCYQLTASIQDAVNEMAAKGVARIYPEKVRFVTGVPYPIAKSAPGGGKPHIGVVREVPAIETATETAKSPPRWEKKTGRRPR
jgi:hypothetical protein